MGGGIEMYVKAGGDYPGGDHDTWRYIRSFLERHTSALTLPVMNLQIPFWETRYRRVLRSIDGPIHFDHVQA
jgi:hypothetical protein